MDTLEGRLFKPPKLTSLNMDLASLRGGSSCPAQYEGKTHDGRGIYCRYRDGYLSVTLANAAGADLFRDGTRILDERIGPPLHGDISLGQLCRYTGMTVAGELPRLPTRAEAKENTYFDLSGETTFYFCRVRSTVSSARGFLARLLRDLPDTSLVERLWDERFSLIGGRLYDSADDIKTNRCHLLLGQKATEAALTQLSDEADLEEIFPRAKIFEINCWGLNRPPFAYSKDTTERFAEHLGRSLRVSGQESDCLYTTLLLSSRFPTSNAERLAQVQAFDRLVNDCYPIADYLCFDLESGERYPDKDGRGPIDPVIAEWIAGGEDRWSFVGLEDGWENPTFLGYRPRIASQ